MARAGSHPNRPDIDARRQGARLDGRTPGVRLEMADVLRRHGEAYRLAHAGHLGRVEHRVMSAITACRTAALGGHVEACDDCAATRIAYNSCRNRHCPKCQGPAREAWLAARQAELLPVPYFHVVFTLPEPVAEIAFHNKAVVYAILFKAAAEAMTTLAANPRRLGAEIGFIAVLHSWGQTLTHHPHLHCVVPGGGLSPDQTRWVAGRADFFLAVKPLAQLFRRLFLERLKAAFDAGDLAFFTDLAPLADPDAFSARLAAMRRLDWVVYAKKPFGGPAQVLAYLGRYTHRVAIANSRLVALDQTHVTFSWKDYRHNGVTKIMRLKPDEFIRRFLLHTLPDGFRRIRSFGFMANGHRAAKLALCRSLIAQGTAQPAPQETASPADPTNEQVTDAPPACPHCGGRMRFVGFLSPIPADCQPARRHTAPFRCDTS